MCLVLGQSHSWHYGFIRSRELGKFCSLVMGELDEFNNSILGKLGDLNPRIWMLGVFDLKPCLVHKLVYLDNCVGNLVGLAGFV